MTTTVTPTILWVWVNLDSSSPLFPYVASLLPCTTSTPAAEGIDLANAPIAAVGE